MVIQSLINETLKTIKLFHLVQFQNRIANDVEVKTTNYDFARKAFLFKFQVFDAIRDVTNKTLFFLVQPTTTVLKPKIETEFFSFFPNPKISDSTVGSSKLLRFFRSHFSDESLFFKDILTNRSAVKRTLR